MLLSEDKINHLAHLILRELEQDPKVRPLASSPLLLKEIKRSLLGELRVEDEVDAEVRRQLSSYSRKIVEGSPEWDVLYRKAFEQEMKRRKR